MATIENATALTADEAAMLLDLIGTYMADRCEADGGAGNSIVPPKHQRRLEFAMRKLEDAAGAAREDYEYWQAADCDGDLRHI